MRLSITQPTEVKAAALRKKAAKADTMLSLLEEAYPEEISAWVDNNIQSLLDVKDLLKLLLNRIL